MTYNKWDPRGYEGSKGAMEGSKPLTKYSETYKGSKGVGPMGTRVPRVLK